MNKIFIYDLKPFSMPTANIKMKQISAALWGQLLVEPLGTEAVCIAFVDMHIYCAYVNQIERIGTHSSWLTKAVVFPTHQLLGYL